MKYDITKMSERGYTCLHEAVYYGNYDVVASLKHSLDARGDDVFAASLFIKNGKGETVFGSFDAGETSWTNAQSIWKDKSKRVPEDIYFFNDPRYHKDTEDVNNGYDAIWEIMHVECPSWVRKHAQR
jgi:ankyrin repeat protein